MNLGFGPQNLHCCKVLYPRPQRGELAACCTAGHGEEPRVRTVGRTVGRTPKKVRFIKFRPLPPDGSGSDGFFHPLDADFRPPDGLVICPK